MLRGRSVASSRFRCGGIQIGGYVIEYQYQLQFQFICCEHRTYCLARLAFTLSARLSKRYVT
jgi:hypothetical protein